MGQVRNGVDGTRLSRKDVSKPVGMWCICCFLKATVFQGGYRVFFVCTSESTEVQLSRQTRGSHAPVASQKGAITPLRSNTGEALIPNRVAEVPRETTS